MSNGKVRWGILSTAAIGMKKVIPAMLKADNLEVVAIASRDEARAREAADELRIPQAFGSYEALLEAPDVDAVYVPVPNHLHVPWSIAALEAGKHVLCEKPVGMNAEEAERLLEASRQHPRLKVMEAFMYRLHPQWQRAKAIVDEGGVGDLRTVHSFFSYSNLDPQNVRNMADIGGGGLMDIGCYDISISRFLFGAEPERVVATVELDPEWKTDRLVSAILDFGERGTATFTCATQLVPYQRVHAYGTQGRVELEIPFNAPQDGPCRLWHQRGAETAETVFDRTDQYTLQAEAFSKAVLDDRPVPTPLEDAVANMRVIDAIRESGSGGGWVPVARG